MDAETFFNRLIYITGFVILTLLIRKAADKQTAPWVRTLSLIIVLAVYAIAFITLLIFAIFASEVELLKRLLALVFASIILWNAIHTFRSFKNK